MNIVKIIASLSNMYQEDDPYGSYEVTETGYTIVEKNCPFQQVAMTQPGLCSTTVSTFANLLGADVKRNDRFQNGDRQCTFVITPTTKPIQSMAEFHFQMEDDPEPSDR